jgi:hypothetical protein
MRMPPRDGAQASGAKAGSGRSESWLTRCWSLVMDLSGIACVEFCGQPDSPARGSPRQPLADDVKKHGTRVPNSLR